MVSLEQKLKALEKLEAEATPAPWDSGEPIDGACFIGTSGDNPYHITTIEEDGPFIAAARNEMKFLLSTIRKMRGALEFYTDKNNWDDDFTPTIWDDGRVDLGDRAKKCLEEIEELSKGE